MQKGAPKASKDSIFTDAISVVRKDDSLQIDYTTRQVVERIWSDHFKPRMRFMMVAGLAMAVSAATTGAVPLIIQRAGDEIFVNQNKEMIASITIAAIMPGGTRPRTRIPESWPKKAK